MKSNISNVVKNINQWTKRHGSEILISIGAASSISAVVLAIKATPKAVRLIDERKEELDAENLDATEIVKTVWTCYIPTAMTEIFSMVCLICAATNNNKHNAALTAAYALSENAFREYRDKIIDTIGEQKEKSIRDSIAKDRIENNPPTRNEISIGTAGDQLCYDALSDRYFKSSADKIKKAQNELNARMLQEQNVSLNDFYYEVGLNDTLIGDSLGWDINKTNFIDIYFNTQLADGDIPCLVVDFSSNPPVYDYLM